MADEPRKFFKTVIQVVVLSEGEYDDPGSLSQVAYDIDEGDCSGQYHILSSREVDGPTMAKLLIEQDSEPGFFGLTDEGEDQDAENERLDNICDEGRAAREMEKGRNENPYPKNSPEHLSWDSGWEDDE
jgi:hypothetical protein